MLAEAEVYLDGRDFASLAQVEALLRKMVKMIILLRDRTTPESRGQVAD